MTESRTVVVVQGARDVGAVPGLAGIEDRTELRFADDADALAAALPGAEVMLGWDFRAGALARAWPAADRLRWIHWAGAGVDAVLFPELIASDVVLTNARAVFDRAMAEYALGVIIAFEKHLPQTIRLQGERVWRHRLTGRIEGKAVLVVGAGSIGRAVARLLGAAGMVVRVVGRSARDDAELGRVHGFDELDALLPWADHVVLIAPLTPQTRACMDGARLARMRSSAYLVNLGRGQLVDESALIDALGAGAIAGAALDVFETEPLPSSSPLWDMPNVIVSPHMSGDFVGCFDVLASQFLDNFRRYRAGEPLVNVVDKRLGFVAAR
ncbi:MAG: D-2-hydroxyacid dehydrogenase [Ectothiorhodospiraceae bacterium]|nr:D-2-hydroxyacid dehydrogenase [Chromatiales bacterium]MCP5157259.1 D-2-hydroxyacid dehydrogenase [Ectothiorhodospiraceae bacterium]